MPDITAESLMQPFTTIPARPMGRLCSYTGGVRTRYGCGDHGQWPHTGPVVLDGKICQVVPHKCASERALPIYNQNLSHGREHRTHVPKRVSSKSFPYPPCAWRLKLRADEGVVLENFDCTDAAAHFRLFPKVAENGLADLVSGSCTVDQASQYYKEERRESGEFGRHT
jgi:hypothetical protein